MLVRLELCGQSYDPLFMTSIVLAGSGTITLSYFSATAGTTVKTSYNSLCPKRCDFVLQMTHLTCSGGLKETNGGTMQGTFGRCLIYYG